MNVMVVGLLAIVGYFIVVAIWMKRQKRHLPAAGSRAVHKKSGGTP